MDSNNPSQDIVSRSTERTQNKIYSTLMILHQVRTDPERDARLLQGLCQACFYMPVVKIVGHAFVSRPCATCEVEMTFSSTNVAVICITCAKEHHQCTRCGLTLTLPIEEWLNADA